MAKKRKPQAKFWAEMDTYDQVSTALKLGGVWSKRHRGDGIRGRWVGFHNRPVCDLVMHVVFERMSGTMRDALSAFEVGMIDRDELMLVYEMCRD